MSSSISPSITATEHVVAFGQPRPGALYVPLPVLTGGAAVETWSSGEDVLFGAAIADEAKPLEHASRELYARMIREAREAGFPFFLRIWNYVGEINGQDAGCERYKLFCAGRHDAFVEAGYHHDVDLPAGSAVGMRGRGLVTYFLAAREPGTHVENPRQVAAYNYPPQYGVKSPSFSRATVWNDTVFVSGTASVLGHATAHRGDVLAQLDETLRNLEAVLSQTGRTLADVVSAKTYIRDAADYEAISRRLRGVLANNLYLQADICRADLLLDIECVAR
jgi:chorismate lyase/3-hydroxybenzoate synthase